MPPTWNPSWPEYQGPYSPELYEQASQQQPGPAYQGYGYGDNPAQRNPSYDPQRFGQHEVISESRPGGALYYYWQYPGGGQAQQPQQPQQGGGYQPPPNPGNPRRTSGFWRRLPRWSPQRGPRRADPGKIREAGGATGVQSAHYFQGLEAQPYRPYYGGGSNNYIPNWIQSMVSWRI